MGCDAKCSSFNDTFLGRYFKLTERGSTLGTEIRAGITTFLTLAYIIAVNPIILMDSGGTCNPTCHNGTYNVFAPCYETCMQEVRRDLVVVTAGTSALACFLMGSIANLPFVLAPGMGINAYFTYTVVGFRGTGPFTYEQGLGAVMIEGIIFMVLALSGFRGYFMALVPPCIKIAASGGIFLFFLFSSHARAHAPSHLMRPLHTCCTQESASSSPCSACRRRRASG